MAEFHDPVLGAVTLKRYKNSRHIKIRLQPDGNVVVSAPYYTPLFIIKKFTITSRNAIEQARLQATSSKHKVYEDQDIIGKSHKIILIREGTSPSSYSVGQIIRWLVPDTMSPRSNEAQQALKDTIENVLRKQAKAYLPRQLKHLASKHGYTYQKLRFGNAKGRWGSCSSNGTISLNIALMTLPNELIDYVLIHELCHTRQMNHSPEFWSLVAEGISDYKIRRQELKKYSPYV